MTKEEKMAIAQLKRAMTKCEKLGIGIFGMDWHLNAVSKKGIYKFKESGENGDYGDSDASASRWCQQNGFEDETATVCHFGGCGGW